MHRSPLKFKSCAGVLIAAVLLMLTPAVLSAQEMGYLDYLDSYYKTGNANELELAKNSIKTDLDTSLALKIQGYYYNAEIEYLLAYENLKREHLSEEKVSNLKNLLLELYDRYLESYYQIKKEDIQGSSLEGNTAYLFKDIFLATAILPSANSISPMVKNLLRRANREQLFNTDNSFVASVNDIFLYEEPNLFGISNLLKAVWAFDKYMATEAPGLHKDSLREAVSYHSAIALDTLKSNFAGSVASFLLASTRSNILNDDAWNYFQKCLELSLDDSDFPKSGFYAKNYNRDIYVATTVAFLPAYCEYLFNNNRYKEVLKSTQYLVNLDLLDPGMLENVSKEAIFWGEKSIRILQENDRYEDSDDMYRQLQAYYELLKPGETYGNQPE